MKTKKIGNIGMTTEAYDKFVSLPYKEQLERVYNSLRPKDYVEAAKALKGIPNGEVGSRDEEAANEGVKPSAGGSKKDNSAKPGVTKD